ncbi:hypothetical protein ACVTTK_11525 [Alcaligenes nematophilus]
MMLKNTKREVVALPRAGLIAAFVHQQNLFLLYVQSHKGESGMSLLYTLLALTPLLVVFLLMVVMGRSAKLSMGAAYLVTAILALFVWGSQAEVIAAATINGIVTALPCCSLYLVPCCF